MMGELLQITAGAIVAYSAGQRVNHHGPRTPMLDRIIWSVIGAAGLMAVLGVPLSRLPVVVAVQMEVVDHQPGELRVHITGRKPADRSMCELRGIDAYVTSSTGRQIEVPWVAEDDPAPGNTRPPGQHDFGVWRLTYPTSIRVTQASWVAYHRCAWWMPMTRTQLGPVQVPGLS